MLKNNNINAVYKPKNFTSNDICQIIKKKWHFKKVGHAGTLDPNTTGVLVIGINNGTKMLTNLIQNNKTYVAQIQIGIKTNTGDITGKIIEKCDNCCFDKEIIEKIQFFLDSLISSDYYQVPHKFSAVKINGVKSYELARKNIDFKLAPKLVYMYNYKLLNYNNNMLEIEIDVSKGFYIRSLVEDISKEFSIPLTLKELCRTVSGKYKLSDCVHVVDEE